MGIAHFDHLIEVHERASQNGRPYRTTITSTRRLLARVADGATAVSADAPEVILCDISYRD
jgi:hypothetical protein